MFLSYHEDPHNGPDGLVLLDKFVQITHDHLVLLRYLVGGQLWRTKSSDDNGNIQLLPMSLSSNFRLKRNKILSKMICKVFVSSDKMIIVMTMKQFWTKVIRFAVKKKVWKHFMKSSVVTAHGVKYLNTQERKDYVSIDAKIENIFFFCMKSIFLLLEFLSLQRQRDRTSNWDTVKLGRNKWECQHDTQF